jgi:hypothetical protein
MISAKPLIVFNAFDWESTRYDFNIQWDF